MNIEYTYGKNTPCWEDFPNKEEFVIFLLSINKCFSKNVVNIMVDFTTPFQVECTDCDCNGIEINFGEKYEYIGANGEVLCSRLL